MRVHNFAAGPAALPLEVLERAQSELTDFNGLGMSVMEISHRSKDFVAVASESEALLRELLGVPEGYTVLFLQGGATGQFAAIPMNLTASGASADYLNTGSWSKKAIAEAGKYVQVNVLADEKASNYSTTPAAESISVSPGAAYLHYTANETIGGVEFGYVPETGDVPLVADFSSTIMSRPIDVSKFGLIYAGAQKNLGPSGITVVIVRDDLVGTARPETPSVLDYAAMGGADSMLNTPPTFGWYLLGLNLEWIRDNGGLTGMAERNERKARTLYDAIDTLDFYSNPVEPGSRSWMNVPFLLANADLDKEFLAQADAAGLTNLAGHRSVGGMRASIYNATSQESVEALVDFLKEFERTHA
ncbi:3-phosphoserine/phosphohydroxythreonine transaminase [Ornithinimicrobium faecis]|uniref:Phosphoserine aminotransferase n=1 Tax=Ornithinimicrobium faecis TaxID=2934158 RepID=A0ABY4YPW2_9MICO|nr:MULTISPECIES: 3-phosphoserine/phosphohydroxythreonine transaminase [unclassified Ornithinimicrobium]USQ78540.1 3-phosphoserine/phosphohydroxythreonine transaminase [Ornithinimicrobium sp. HY1793]